MLQKQTVEGRTFYILNELMNLDFLKEFNLVGGTALSLQLGHRKSIDLDLFNINPFDIIAIRQQLKNYFKERIDIVSSEKNPLGVFSKIDNIKIDICKHPHALLYPVLVEENIRMWGLQDIAASKVFAISARATKKDFWDLDILLDHFSFLEIAAFYDKRYKHELAISISKMLTYFNEAEESEVPVCLLGKNWEQVKKNIFKKINEHTK